MTLPKAYAWLDKEPGPKMVKIATTLYGLHEGAGRVDNQVILGWARDLGAKAYTHDSIAWCGLFMAHVAKLAGYTPPPGYLSALSWGGFGLKANVPMLGDVASFWRGSPNSGLGHVGILIAETAENYIVISGNTNDAVGFDTVPKRRLHAIRRPPYHIQPANVRRIFMGYSGPLTTREA